jgi:hypothetical protein
VALWPLAGLWLWLCGLARDTLVVRVVGGRGRQRGERQPTARDTLDSITWFRNQTGRFGKCKNTPLPGFEPGCLDCWSSALTTRLRGLYGDGHDPWGINRHRPGPARLCGPWLCGPARPCGPWLWLCGLARPYSLACGSAASLDSVASLGPVACGSVASLGPVAYGSAAYGSVAYGCDSVALLGPAACGSVASLGPVACGPVASLGSVASLGPVARGSVA